MKELQRGGRWLRKNRGRSRFNKIADKFVDSFLTKKGESVADARKRLAAEQIERIKRKKVKATERE